MAMIVHERTQIRCWNILDVWLKKTAVLFLHRSFLTKHWLQCLVITYKMYKTNLVDFAFRPVYSQKRHLGTYGNRIILLLLIVNKAFKKKWYGRNIRRSTVFVFISTFLTCASFYIKAKLFSIPLITQILFLNTLTSPMLL